MAQTTRRETNLVRRPEDAFVPLRQVMDRLFQESFLLPSIFDRMGALGAPSGSNLWETGESYIVQLAMPGLKPDSISCTVEDNVLTCRGETALQASENAKEIWHSFGGEMEYRIQIPTEVEGDRAQATYEHGVLTVTLPKAAHARARTIKVVAK